MLRKKLLPNFAIVIFSLFTLVNAQERNVLIEYCAGTWCATCPLAAQTVQNDILPAHPNTIVLAYHGWAGSSDPFSDFEGNQIIDLLQFNSYPTGRIDRVTDALPDYHWLENVEPRTETPPLVDIVCEIVFDTLARKAAVVVKSSPILEDIKEDCNLTVELVEDGIVYPQHVMGDSLIDYDYVHLNVVREIVSSVAGDELNAGEIWSAGTIIEKEYSVDIDESYDFRNCRIVAFVHFNEKELFRGEALQAVSENIYEEPTGIEDDARFLSGFELSQNYPNPFSKSSNGNSFTTIKYSIPNVGEANFTSQNFMSPANVQLKIYDLLGREVATLVNEIQTPGNYSVRFNVENLSPGVYFYSIKVIGNSNKLIFSSTKKMLLYR